MGSFKPPAEGAVEAALLRIPTVQLRRVFYEGLNNPLWVKPLFEAKAFKDPPEPVPTGDGYIRDIYWPEIDYLTRMATEVPGDVVDVLLSLKSSNNAWVKRALFEIGAKIPAAEGARLRPVLEAWKATGFGWRTDPRALVSFATALLQGGETRVGRWLANLLFAPSASAEDGRRRRPQLGLDDYWYQEGLPQIVPALGDDALKALVGWLVDYEKFAGHASSDHDFSAMSRPLIRSRRDAYDNAEQSLIDAVRDEAQRLMPSDPADTLSVLTRSGLQIVRKIALFVTAEAIKEVTARGDDAQGLVSAAQKLLGDESSDDDYFRIEYAELAKAVAAVDTVALHPIVEFIQRARAKDLARWRERLGKDGTEGETEQEAELWADRATHAWLSAIGQEALPTELQELLAQLDGNLGVIDDPLVPLGVTTSWTGPNPHSTQDEMASMSPSELAAHLASWHATGDGWGPEPSHEGQGRELAGLLTTRPRALAGVRNLVDQLRPTYIRAILQGWEVAFKADLDLDWDEVADLIEAVLAHADATSFPVEGRDMDDDKDFRWAKSAAVSLLEELAKRRDSVTIPDDSMARYAELLIVGADDERAWEEYDEYEHSDDSWDPLNMSLNWQWPKRLRGLFYLATRSAEEPWKEAVFSAIDRELARTDKHGAGRAVLGENFGRLLSESTGSWLREHLIDFVGSADGVSTEQQIVLSTVIAMHYYHRTLYDLLRDSMVAAVRLEQPIVSGWRSDAGPLQRIGQWGINSLMRGDTGYDDPLLSTFFTSVDADTRGETLGSVAWSLFHAERVDDEIRDRFADFWDSRVAHVRAHPEDSKELKGAYWLALGGKFEVAWWLSRLRDALQLEPSIATERYMIGKELAQASATYPRDALDVLKLLLEGRDEGGMVSYVLSTHAVPVVIANALRSGDAELAEAATDYMNELGAKGNLRLEAEVQAVLDGSITDADVDG